MASSSTMRHSWGKASEGFSEYLMIAGQTIGKETANRLADAGAEFLANEDWDWPRGQRFTSMNLNTGQTFRASGPYASGFHGGDEMHPWYTGNLHDSLAVGVIKGNRILAKRYMTPGASVLQSYGTRSTRTIDGVTEGERALNRAANTFAKGTHGDTLRAVFVIGVPYAEDVNESDAHAGYADALAAQFYSTLAPTIEHIRKIKLKLK